MRIGAMNDPERNVFEEIRWFGENGFDYIDLTIEAPATATGRRRGRRWRRRSRCRARCGVPHGAPYLPIDNPSPLVRQAALDSCAVRWARRIVEASLCTMHFARLAVIPE
ncbi:MAG: hypothetical protein R2856_26475 [Caldilineaceae bacterium]